MNLLILFIILNIVNVILQTAKSIATMKCGRLVASIANGIAYGLYTVVIVYTNCDLDLWAKVAVVVGTNLIGVFIVKTIEEKLRKDRLWKIEFTVKEAGNDTVNSIHNALDVEGISHNYMNIGKHTIFNCFCSSKKESAIVRKYVKEANAKYFASETKLL